MMKSFFKKLAFVMALAMVVSMVAPAGSALAAEAGVSLQGTKTIVKTYELEKVGDTVDFSFQGAKNPEYKTTSKWTSSNEAVATVDKNGVVTAVAAGTATITITSHADGSYVQTVEVTVKEEKKADAFTVAQVDLTKFSMTFNAKKDVKADDVAVVMMINNVEAPIPVRNVAVNDEVATITLFSEFIDGVTYKVTYANETQSFIGSVGEIAYVAFEYWTVEEGDGLAYVSTDEESSVTKLEYQLYDANGVNVTDAYDEDSLTVTYDLVSESDAYEVVDNELIFYEPGAAAVTVTVTWTDEEGEETSPAPFTGVVVASRRPALTHSILEAGFINADDYVEENGVNPVTDFTTNPDSVFWKNNSYTTNWVYKDGGDLRFAALVKDSRGNKVVTGLNKQDDFFVNDDGDVVYPYGYFKFTTSNDDVVDVDDEGIVSFWSAGSASIITYFVDTTGEEPKEIFVGATKITVSPARYVATYKINRTSATVASTAVDGSTNSINFVIAALDQYGMGVALENNEDDISIKTTSTNESFPSAWKEITNIEESTHATKSWGVANCTGWWCDGIGAPGVHYHFTLDGDDFKEYLGKDTSKTITYTIAIDKEENPKLTTGTTKFKFTVKNTNTYAEKLADEAATKFYYSANQDTTSVDLFVDYYKNFTTLGDPTKTDVKTAKVAFDYLSGTNGLVMKAVDNFEDITALEEVPKTGDAGVLYVKVTAPKDAYNDDDTHKNWDYEISGGAVNFTFNTGNATTLKYAKTGAYKVSVYYVKNTSIKDDGTGNLSPFGTYTFNVSNSQPNPKFAGYDAKLGNKTDTELSVETALDVVKENLVFTYEGKVIDWTNEDYRISLYDWDVNAKKLRVNKVTITVPVDDKNDSGYSYTKTITVGKTIYFEESED